MLTTVRIAIDMFTHFEKVMRYHVMYLHVHGSQPAIVANHYHLTYTDIC